jgi:hypothetical protein
MPAERFEFPRAQEAVLCRHSFFLAGKKQRSVPSRNGLACQSFSDSRQRIGVPFAHPSGALPVSSPIFLLKHRVAATPALALAAFAA